MSGKQFRRYEKENAERQFGGLIIPVIRVSQAVPALRKGEHRERKGDTM
jgi:hypothetical protein